MGSSWECFGSFSAWGSQASRASALAQESEFIPKRETPPKAAARPSRRGAPIRSASRAIPGARPGLSRRRLSLGRLPRPRDTASGRRRAARRADTRRSAARGPAGRAPAASPAPATAGARAAPADARRPPPRARSGLPARRVACRDPPRRDAGHDRVDPRRHRLSEAEVATFTLTGASMRLWRIQGPRDVRGVIRELANEPAIASLQPNYLYRPSDDAAPAAPPSPPQYALDKMHVDALDRRRGRTGQGRADRHGDRREPPRSRRRGRGALRRDRRRRPRRRWITAPPSPARSPPTGGCEASRRT